MSQSLPPQPDLDHLKQQARDLMAAGGASKLSDAQFKIARQYGFASWPKLKAEVQSRQEIGQLKASIDRNDLASVIRLMTANPDLHRAPLGYGKNGPLTWAAECRIPSGPPTPERLAIVRWMLENGSDVHQGGDGPLMRASLNGARIPMMELLVAHGGDVNALWNGSYPIVLAPCETLQAEALRWLLAHGADPNVASPLYGNPVAMLLGTYARDPDGKHACLDVLADAGCAFPDTPTVALHRGRRDLLEAHLRRDPGLLARRFSLVELFSPEVEAAGNDGIGATPLDGATLLHLAVETGDPEMARWLLERGADPNAHMGDDGPTPLFHTVIAFGAKTDTLTRLLLERGADPNRRATVRRSYPWLDSAEEQAVQEMRDVTPLDYARAYRDQGCVNAAAVTLLTERSAA